MAEDKDPVDGRQGTGLTPAQKRRIRRRRQQRRRRRIRADLAKNPLLNPNNVLGLDKDYKPHPDRNKPVKTNKPSSNSKPKTGKLPGSPKDKKPTGKVKRPGAKSKGTNNKGMEYNGLGGRGSGRDTTNYRKQAATFVQQDINQQIRDLLNEGRGVKRGVGYEVNKANALLDRTKGDLDYIYGELGDFTDAQNQKIADRYTGTKGKLEQLYAALQQQQGQTSDTNRNAAIAEMERLGVQGAGTGRFNEDASYMQQLAAQQQANNMANLEASRSSAAQVGDLFRSMGEASLASAVGRATNTRNDSIQDIRQEGRGQLNDILADIRGVRQNRGNMINQLQMQLEENAYQRMAEQRQQDFNNTLASNQFNLDVAQLNSSNLWNKAKLRQEARRQATLRRQQQREYKSAVGAAKNISKNVGSLLGGIGDTFGF